MARHVYNCLYLIFQNRLKLGQGLNRKVKVEKSAATDCIIEDAISRSELSNREIFLEEIL